MVETDLPEVIAIEAQAHARPWDENAFRSELAHKWSRLTAVRVGGPNASRVVAFCSYWIVHDEIHLLNLVTEQAHRRRGHAQRLLQHMLGVARSRKSVSVILEVRRNNPGAIVLYENFGFKRVGIRPDYYVDNQEDALVMTLNLGSD